MSKFIGRGDALTKFKSMQEILMTENAWFDGHGNLCVHHWLDGKQHLAPSYFHLLGKLKKYPAGHTIPTWAIESEWDDIFHPNMALKKIASGKYDYEESKEVAVKEIHATAKRQCWEHEQAGVPPLAEEVG